MPTGARDATVYKICSSEDWDHALATGTYDGSPDDRRDGFIHLSTSCQLEGTLARHFAGRDRLLLIALPTGWLGPALRWEPSRGGQLFPHLYGTLPVTAAQRTWPLELDASGQHVLPALSASGASGT